MVRIKLYTSNLYTIKILERVNRFVVKAELDGETILCHNTNTGRLHDYLVPGRIGLAIPIKGRKLRYRVVGVLDGEGYSLIDTYSQTIVFEKLIEMGIVPWLSGCRIVSRHPKILSSKLDYLLKCGDEELYMEVKSAVLRNGEAASYPDCPTERGRRHIRDLIKLFESGHKVMLVFLAALPNVKCFVPYREGDEVIYELVFRAEELGVPIKSLAFYLLPDGSINVYNLELPLCRLVD